MTKEELILRLEERQTPYVILEPCEKCQGEVYYARKGRRHNGCVQCRFYADDATATGNSLPQEASEIDGNGVRIYNGRACRVCGENTRIGENAYHAKKGSCRSCAIHQQQEREQGKQLKRLSSAVNEQAHKFVVDSIHRSGCIEVAPRSLIEWLELKDLVMRCRAMNEKERALETGIRWELCHQYPAHPDGTPYRG
ncbi:UNVERIFIED_CONTAM: hypothetical protein RF648_17520, partial [Kocuria sp. CPCC 205274]